MDNFGGYLKAQREKRGIRLEEIASITKIHLHSLELLEANQWAQLPPEPFIRGFITAYAKYVGLDSKEVLARYQEEMQALGVQPEPLMPTPPTAEAEQAQSPQAVIQDSRVSPFTKILAATACLVVLLVVGGVIYLGKQRTEPQTADTAQTEATVPTPTTKEEAPQTPPMNMANSGTAQTPPGVPAATSVPNEQNRHPASPGTSAPQSQPTAAPATAPPVNAQPQTPHQSPSPAAAPVPSANAAPNEPNDAHQVMVQAKQRTWLKVLSDGNRPIEEFLEAGASKTYTAKSKIRVILGNATGTVVMHNGQVVEGIKYMGTIRMYNFPAGAHFPREVSRGAAQEMSVRTEPSLDDESTSAPNDDSTEPVPHEGSESLSPAAQD